jgi:hypothetical protein
MHARHYCRGTAFPQTSHDCTREVPYFVNPGQVGRGSRRRDDRDTPRIGLAPVRRVRGRVGHEECPPREVPEDVVAFDRSALTGACAASSTAIAATLMIPRPSRSPTIPTGPPHGGRRRTCNGVPATVHARTGKGRPSYCAVTVTPARSYRRHHPVPPGRSITAPGNSYQAVSAGSCMLFCDDSSHVSESAQKDAD